MPPSAACASITAVPPDHWLHLNQLARNAVFAILVQCKLHSSTGIERDEGKPLLLLQHDGLNPAKAAEMIA